MFLFEQNIWWRWWWCACRCFQLPFWGINLLFTDENEGISPGIYITNGTPLNNVHFVIAAPCLLSSCGVCLCGVRHFRVFCRNDYRYGHSYYWMRIGNRTQAFKWYNFQWPWTTPNPDFKVTSILFDAECLRNETRWRHSYNGILIGTYTCPTQGCHFESFSGIFSDMKHRAASLQQLIFLLVNL